MNYGGITVKRLFAFIIVVCIITAAIPLSASASEEYLDDTSAAATLRKAMVERKSTVTIYYKTEKEPSNATFPHLMELALSNTGESVEGDYLRWHLNGYSGGGGYWTKNNVYYCDLSFNLLYYTTAKQESELEKAIDDIIAGFGFTEATDDATKIRTVYDFVCDNVTYDYDNLNNESHKLKYSAYAALINGTAVCQGYANLLYRMLYEVGIDNRIIAGKSKGENHAWNIIELNGEYYNADSTWDAGRSDYKYFMKCATHFTEHTRNSEYSASSFNEAHPMADKCLKLEPEQSYCEKHGHDLGEWYTTARATCKAFGEERRDCDNCDHFETRITDKTNHTEGEWVTVEPAAVGKAGSEEKRCTECLALIESRVIPALESETHAQALGDVNGNGKIEKYDYILVKRAVMNTVTLDEVKLASADVNKNGKVEKYDYILIKRHVMNTFVIKTD